MGGNRRAISASGPGAPRKQEALRARTEEDCDKKYNNYKQMVKLCFVIYYTLIYRLAINIIHNFEHL